MSQLTLNERYLLESAIGRGGMGVVYRGCDLKLHRAVAVKVLPPEFTMDEQFLLRFHHEVWNVARLDHPNIVQVFDVGQDGNTHYYVMQLVDGCDLHAELVRRGRFSLDEAVAILSQVAAALDHAHAHGIVHRDIKPENILLDRQGTPHIVDFGIAKSVEGTRLTGGMIGTPEYMAPEQARSEALDGRADQYALAIVAYEMLTGTTPFRSATTQPWALVNMHISVPPPDPRQWGYPLPQQVVAALLQALSKVPEYRLATCRQFVEALSSPTLAVTTTAEQTAVATGSLPAIDSPPAPRSRCGTSLPKLVAALAALLLAGGIWLMLEHRSPVTPPSGIPSADIAPPAPSDRVTTIPPSGSNAPPPPPTPLSDVPGRWPWTAERPVTAQDFAGVPVDDLELMRNEIYARHGWIFKRDDLQRYFDSQPWYRPAGQSVQRDAVNARVITRISDLEKRNAEVILRHEQAVRAR